MNAPSDTAIFYAGISVQPGFRALMDPALYTPLPADWIIGMADIVQSTNAIAEKRYKAVNMAGAAVIGRRDERLGQTPVAMVELRTSTDTDALVEYLRNRLARYEIPTEIAIVDELPRTPSGKPDLSAIRRHFSGADHAG